MKLLLSTTEFFRHHTFADSEEQRLAHLVYQLLRLLLGAIVLISLLLWFLSPVIRQQIAILFLYPPFILLLFYLLHRGEINLTSKLYVASLWVLISVFVLVFEGVSSPAFFSYVIVIVLAGLILDKRAEIVTILFSVAAGATSFIIEFFNLLPWPMSSSTLISTWLGGTASIILLSLLIQRATEGWRLTAKKARQQVEQNQLLREQAEQQAQALQEANQQLKELDHLKTKFIRDMTHELRTPLTNLKLYLDLWQMAPEEKRPLYMATLQQQNDRLAHLMEAVSRVARLDAGVGIQNKTDTNINELVKRVADAYQPECERKNITLSLELSSTLQTVWGVESMLLEVVEHLISNAILYSSQGTITVQTLGSGKAVWLRVSDEGIGIAKHEQARIFDRFYRADNVGELAIAGAGLGLTIVQRVVALHNGEITVNSQLEKGSVFTIVLPAQDKAQAISDNLPAI